MSLSLWLESKKCELCGHQESTASTESLNYTYNVSPMWYEIFPNQKHMVDVDDLTGKESIPLLECALKELIDKPEKFKALNPNNGWGSYEGFMEYIEKLIKLAEKHPDWIWKSCR